MKRLLRSEMPLDTIALSLALLGQTLVSMNENQRVSGRIVEVEAYPLDDPASHAFRGERRRSRSMFLPHWHAYVYRIYGMYSCFNISSECNGVGAAVLIRALEPLEGVEMMKQRRKTDKMLDLTRGPGRLTMALGIGLTSDGDDLDTSRTLWIEQGFAATNIMRSSRIGISNAMDMPLRFYDAESPYISGKKSFNALSQPVRFEEHP